MKKSFSSLTILIVTVCSLFSCSRPTQHETKLIFGRRIGDTALVSDSDWNKFVNEVIVPKFPSGFTIDDVDGYYRMSNGEIIHEPSKVLLVLEEKDENNNSKLDSIANEYIRRFHQESVLKEESPVVYEFENEK